MSDLTYTYIQQQMLNVDPTVSCVANNNSLTKFSITSIPGQTNSSGTYGSALVEVSQLGVSWRVEY